MDEPDERDLAWLVAQEFGLRLALYARNLDGTRNEALAAKIHERLAKIHATDAWKAYLKRLRGE